MRKHFTLLLLLLAGSMALEAQDSQRRFEIAKNLETFAAIYKNLELMYVDSLQSGKVIKTGIDAMLDNLDPYTEYYPPESKQDFITMLTGKYGGLGATIVYNPKVKYVMINDPFEGMPADRAGLKRGDMIVRIDGKDMKGRPTSYVTERLRGEAGTTFLLEVKRPTTGKTLKMKIERAIITRPAVPYFGMINKETGYLSLTEFTQDCAKQVRKAVASMKEQGMKSLVFDLRNNGGGAENEAVDIVSIFVPKGKTVVANRNMKTRKDVVYKTTDEPLDTIMPMVVLVNANTASASEIVSGALQDMDRAVIMGTRTFGKGLVQSTVSLPFGGMLKLTTNHYYIPSGRCIQAVNYQQGDRSKAAYIPDSLTQVFKTANGREVRDGGGIRPDVEIKGDSIPYIAYALAVEDSTLNMMNYVIDYVARHPQIAPAESFEVSEADFQAFKQQVVASGWIRPQRANRTVEELEELTKFEGNYNTVKSYIEQLKQQLKPNMAQEMEDAKADIKRALATDIVRVYYHERGAVRNTLNGDKRFEAALNLLKQPLVYNNILKPAQKSNKMSNTTPTP